MNNIFHFKGVLEDCYIVMLYINAMSQELSGGLNNDIITGHHQ